MTTWPAVTKIFQHFVVFLIVPRVTVAIQKTLCLKSALFRISRLQRCPFLIIIFLWNWLEWPIGDIKILMELAKIKEHFYGVLFLISLDRS